jgi:trans-aconitate 2-methyltransferase
VRRHGNIATVAAALVDLGIAPAWNFATPEATVRRLADAGFTDAEVWLEPHPVELEPGEPLLTYLATIPLKDVVATVPEHERRALVEAVAGRLPGPVLDYVRLNITARLG